MRILDCPECAVPMQAFYAQSDDSAVELDRCPRCTRLWFDVRELERVSGKAFLPRLPGAAAVRSCPACKILLAGSLIRGDVSIEECGACKGALLDAHDFQLISGKPLTAAKPPPLPSARAPRLFEFVCERCRSRTPISHVRNVKGATVCLSCATRPWPNQPGWYSKNDARLADLLESLFSTLFR